MCLFRFIQFKVKGFKIFFYFKRTVCQVFLVGICSLSVFWIYYPIFSWPTRSLLRNLQKGLWGIPFYVMILFLVALKILSFVIISNFDYIMFQRSPLQIESGNFWYFCTWMSVSLFKTESFQLFFLSIDSLILLRLLKCLYCIPTRCLISLVSSLSHYFFLSFSFLLLWMSNFKWIVFKFREEFFLFYWMFQTSIVLFSCNISFCFCL